MTDAPSAELREDVFRRAESTRALREELRAEVRSGAVGYDDLFVRAERDPVIASGKILPLIEVIPDVGKVRSRRALEAVGISERARLAAVTGRDREQLRDLLLGGSPP